MGATKTEHFTEAQNQIAIIDENDGRNYTYEEVANKAKRVSSYLKEQGVAPGDLLAVSLSRGINQIISILENQ